MEIGLYHLGALSATQKGRKQLFKILQHYVVICANKRFCMPIMLASGAGGAGEGSSSVCVDICNKQCCLTYSSPVSRLLALAVRLVG